MNIIEGRTWTKALIACVLTCCVVGCATTQSTRSNARIEIQEQVGFTITEEARVSEGTRGDHNRALLLIQQGDSAEGIALLQQVADATPQLSAPRIDLGIAYSRADNLQAAEEHLLMALVSNSQHPIAHNELGIVYRRLGRFDEARQHYEAALSIYPEFHYARRNLAVLCDLYLGDLQCALNNYEAYRSIVPDDEEARMWVADIRNRVGN